MPKISVSDQNSPTEYARTISAIGNLLNGSLSVDNIQGDYVSGVTSATPDSVGQVKHSFKPEPIAMIPVVGDVYAYEMTGAYLDIRSRLASQPYTVYVITGKRGRI